MAFGSALSMVEDPQSCRKERGAFFTPPELGRYIAEWAIRDREEKIIEPSCGEGEFLLAACNRLQELGASISAISHQIEAFEIHDASADQALRRLKSSGFSCGIKVGNYLELPSTDLYDVVIGNPPYVRFQAVDGKQKALSREIADRNKVSFSGLSSLWVSFVLKSCEGLRKGGRLAFVLPAELLSVNYASSIRAFLMDSFSEVQVVTFEKRVFPEVQEEVIILLAQGFGEGSCDSLIWRQCLDIESLRNARETAFAPRTRSERWFAMLVPSAPQEALTTLLQSGKFVPLSEWGRISLGSVTGANTFFAMTSMTMNDFGISRKDCVRIVPPGSKHIRKLSISEDDLDELDAMNVRTFLFRPENEELSAAALKYIELGEKLRITQAYKCRQRNPWWRVPLSQTPDLLITYMNSEVVNICSNEAHAEYLNSCHGLVLNDDAKGLGMELLPLAFLNSATLFSAEMVGRSYGGGVLKLEPKEAASVLTPSPAFIYEHADELRKLRPRIERLLSCRDYQAVVDLLDGVMKESFSEIGVSIADLSRGRKSMRARRASRSKSVRR
ncbi:HsdM family class I SAM-dependent methyltransferase [Slackia isoflavoniconvertens]|uniref:HsdM family class I SAM-dependent methyltransferase n=1 Tax=Slackia isoflavoniconvertens TaxID=572010 RepID=UPI003AB99515